MNEKQLFEFYKKLYFNEIERRDKVEQRLQLPLAILIVIAGFLAYLIQNVTSEASGIAVYLFWFFLSTAIATMGVVVWFFKKSWIGYKYKLIPTPATSEDYRSKCIELFKDFEEADVLTNNAMRQYLHDSFVDYSSWNMENNDTKALNLSKMASALIASFMLCAFAFLPFYLGGLDKQAGIEQQKVLNKKLDNIIKIIRQKEEIKMAKKPIPKPPPQPEPRVVRESPQKEQQKPGPRKGE